MGTGKFLAIDEIDRKKLTLINTAVNLDTLFCFKSEMQTKKESKFKDEEEEGEEAKLSYMHSGQRVMLMSYVDMKYLQLLEDLDDQEIEQFRHKQEHINEPFNESSQ